MKRFPSLSFRALPWLIFLCMTGMGFRHSEAKMRLVENGMARCVILTQPGAIPSERYAARELAQTLEQMTGVAIPIEEDRSGKGSKPAHKAAIYVGPGPSAAAAFPEIAFDKLGPEEIVLRTKGGRLLLAGGRPRGTLYAVSRFLQDQCGVRWWTPWASTIPKRRTLLLGDLNIAAKPAFEMREPFWYPAFDGVWAARNCANGQAMRLTPEMGGKITYKGFVHTFYPLVPPEQHFQAHPEWYSLINGRRTTEGAQLCTTNPLLRDFVVERVREWLRESPEANIVSVSQNDWYGACQCPTCKALDDREGSHSGTMLSLVNYAAEKLSPEFPNVAIDTLAYQYTRKAPKTVRPLPNVIVRLCSIECNFAEPLEHPSNAAFASDIRDWSQRSDRLYIWDYVTNFAHYVQPHPNWFVLGPNVRFFHKHGVKGLFEQGAYQSHGAEMAEMRAWVLAQLLWNPYQDDRKLISEFLNGYYGKAARPIREYMTRMSRAAKDYYLGIGSPPSAPFLRFVTLSQAERLWQQAAEAVKNDPERLWRVQQGRMPLRYVWLTQWTPLRAECLRAGAEWPLSQSRKEVAEAFLRTATGPGPDGWSRVTHLNESGLTPEAFVANRSSDLPDPPITPLAQLPKRNPNPPPPADLKPEAVRGAVDGQDGMARLYQEGVYAEVRPDKTASDGLAVWMPGTHHEWAFQLPIVSLPARARKGRWQVSVVLRVESEPGADPKTPAFTAGVYDGGEHANSVNIAPPLSQTAPTYRAYLLGTVDTTVEQYIWVAPTAQPGIRALWIDRVYLMPAR